jgi:putative Mg2+ transporter-C (MgtC) family protein
MQLGLAAGLGDTFLRLAAAVLVGGVLGLNRDLHNKPAGLRTHALVSLGSSLVMVVSLRLAMQDGRGDPSAALRTVQGIITGIGFIGAGVILHDRLGKNVHGLTTAATIWLACGLGLTCGAGLWPAALLGVSLTLLVLTFGGPIERAFHRRFHRPVEGETAPPPGRAAAPLRSERAGSPQGDDRIA